jgi:thiol-disulfide isomerase/thioredoxin
MNKNKPIMKKQLILLCILITIFNTDKVLSQPKVGQQAPEIKGFKMITTDFPDLKNKFVFLDFWATWNSAEVRSLDHINSLAKRFKNKIVFLAVSDETEDQVLSFIHNNKWYNIFFGLDNERILHKNFTVKDIPVYYLISPENIILSTGISNEIKDSELDSIVVRNDSIKQVKPLILQKKVIRKKK